MARTVAGDVRVLHVEDDEAFAELTARRLGAQGFAVDVETDPTAVLDRLGERRYDCVVSDYEMPDLDGLELLESVRAEHPELPFLLFTGKGSEEIASEAIQAGVTDYLRKSGDAESFTLLANRIDNAVSGYRTAERYERLLETAPMPIGIYTADGIAFVNGAAAEFLGVEDRDAIVGTDPLELFPEDERADVAAKIRRVLEDREAVGPLERTFVRPDGERRQIRLASKPVTYEGQPAGQVVLEDLTEHRAAREELAREQRRIETAFDAVDDLFLVVDDDGDIVRCNDRVAAVTGVAAEDLVGEPVATVAAEDDRERMAATVQGMLTDGHETAEIRVADEDGDTRAYEFRCVRLTEDGEVVGGCAVGRDITERLDRERELERYRTLVQTIGDPVYATDDEGHLTMVNDAMIELSGFDRERMLDAHVTEFIDVADAIAIRDLLAEVAADPDRHAARHEFEVIDGEGREHVVEANVAPLADRDGDVVGSVGVLRDVTEHRRAERRLRRQNERLDRFAGVVSHDLRNPLNVLTGSIDLAEETGAPEHFDRMRDAAERMERIVDDVLLLARQGQVVSDTEPVALGVVARDAWGRVGTGKATLVVDDDIEAADRDLNDADHEAVEGDRTDPDREADDHEAGGDQRAIGNGDGSDGAADADRPIEPSGTVVEADRERLSALLENLFRNAVEHAGLDATVRVLATDAGFAVADDGPGIPAEDRDTVFEHGYTTADEGTGFGLAIVREIAEAHDWEISVGESETGGAQFEIATD